MRTRSTDSANEDATSLIQLHPKAEGFTDKGQPTCPPVRVKSRRVFPLPTFSGSWNVFQYPTGSSRACTQSSGLHKTWVGCKQRVRYLNHNNNPSYQINLKRNSHGYVSHAPFIAIDIKITHSSPVICTIQATTKITRVVSCMYWRTNERKEHAISYMWE